MGNIVEMCFNPYSCTTQILINGRSASRALYDFIKIPILRHIQMPNLISMSSL